MKLDNYNILLGMAYARELIESSPANISAQTIIENLQRSLVNKPLAQRVGIMIVIRKLREVPVVAHADPVFADLLAALSMKSNEGVAV
jgi:hypothetical protein